MFRTALFSPRGPHVRYEDTLYGMQRALERAFGEGFGTLAAGYANPTAAAAIPVRVDVKEDDKAYHVTAELPGLSEKDVEVTFEDGILTLRGEKKLERDETKDTWHIVERSQGSFARQISLPAAIDDGKIEASFEKGVLKIALPKQPAEQAGAKKINIKTS